MFGWKKKYEVLKEKYDIQKDDLDRLKSKMDYKEKLINLYSSEIEKLSKGYTSLLKLYGFKGFDFKIPYTINAVNRFDLDFPESNEVYEINIPQLRIMIEKKYADKIGLIKNKEVSD